MGTASVGSVMVATWRCYMCVVCPMLCSPARPLDTGLWKGGRFMFEVNIPEEYNMKVM